MEFRVHVGTLGRSVVCSNTNVHRMQIVKKLKQSAVGKIRLTSSTTQTCTLKSIMVFFKVAYGKASVFMTKVSVMRDSTVSQPACINGYYSGQHKIVVGKINCT